MLKLASDENFDGYLVRRLKRQLPNLDLVRVQDSTVYAANDDLVIEWAANENRILLTHDINTIPKFAYERVKAGKPLPGVFAVPRTSALDKVAADLLILIECSLKNEWQDQVVYLPL